MVEQVNSFAIKTKNVSVHYGNKMAIDDVTINFTKNDVTSLIGPCLLYTSPSPRD